MNLEDILEEWETDSQIDITRLDHEATRIPYLHSKYLKKLGFIKRNLSILRKKVNELEKERTEYYRGISDKENYDIKILAKEVPLYLKSDEVMAPIYQKKEEIEAVEYILTSILQAINNRSFQIKNAIEWSRFQSGLN